MKKYDVTRMAREADHYATSQTSDPYDWKEIRDERFAALVAAAEREACAKVCEDEWAALSAAEAIRARGQA